MSLPKEGMPVKGSKKFGTLYVKLIVNLPKKLKQEEKDLYKELFDSD